MASTETLKRGFVRIYREGLELYHFIGHVVNFSKLNENSLIVDAGASIGKFTEELRKRLETNQSKILCIEPSHLNFDKLKNNKELDNVEIINRALTENKKNKVIFTEFKGELKKDGNFYYHEWGNIKNLYKNSETIIANKVEYIDYEVETINLYDITNKYNFIDYLKMDIEGAEYDVIDNINNELANRIEQISIEIHEPLHEYPILIEKLKELKFKVISFDDPAIPGKVSEIYAYK